MADENVFLLYALMMGIFITFLYDILRILRRAVPHGGFLLSLEDICFWIYCAAEVFLMMYHESNGTLRWFAVLGALTGMLLYRRLVSPFFVKYGALWLSRLLGLLGKAAGLLCRPLVFFGKAIKKAAGRVRRSALKHSRSAMRSVRRSTKKKLTFLVKVLKMTI